MDRPYKHLSADELHALLDRSVGKSMDEVHRLLRDIRHELNCRRGRPSPLPESSEHPSSQPRQSQAPTSAATKPASVSYFTGFWVETAEQIPHSKLSSRLKLLSAKDFDTSTWAKNSPMNLLGYKVGGDGLTAVQRQLFLTSFIRVAVLPPILPDEYLALWGAPGTKTRLLRTLSLISSMKSLKVKDDPKRYEMAIRHWTVDIDFLKRTFANLASLQELGHFG